ncbi:calmodulin-2/4-like [Pecten maximus]|uniref:calmodulin-2/4-like n=1 Tax=Pecten maximus TaxID=6579 RepID=UPI0014587CE9|nr:calmodulin-2/4-like [Pecten maximus]
MAEKESIPKKLSSNQVHDIGEVFRLYGNELGTVMRNLGQYPNTDELNIMLKEIEIDGGETSSFVKFVHVMANMEVIGEQSEKEEEKELRQAFRVFDKTGCGYISASDLRAVLKCMGEDFTKEEINEMIAEVDIDGDGRIDFEEFVACIYDDAEDGERGENNTAEETSTKSS